MNIPLVNSRHSRPLQYQRGKSEIIYRNCIIESYRVFKSTDRISNILLLDKSCSRPDSQWSQNLHKDRHQLLVITVQVPVSL